MYPPAAQLEASLLKRIEHLRSVDGVALGLAGCLASVVQANSSAAGLEWSSADGNDDGQENVKVEVQDVDLSSQLEQLHSWVSGGAAVDKPQYSALAHALVQDIMAAVPISGEHAVQAAALSAAWQEDAAGAPSVVPERFKSSLAALATVCCCDGTPKTAAACLGSLLEQLRGQSERWQGLLQQYSVTTTAEQETTDATAAEPPPAADAAADGGSESADVVPASDKSAAGAAPAASAEDDDSSSLGLSRASSAMSLAGHSAPGEEPSAAPPPARARGQQSSKSLGDPDLARKLSQALSGASSADLGELPDNLEAMEQQQPVFDSPTRRAAARPSPLAGTMAGEEGKGHLADMTMDVKQWATMKDKSHQGGGTLGRPPAGPRGAARPGAGMAPLIPLNGAGGKGPDQQSKAGEAPLAPSAPPLLNARTDGPKANPLHNAIVNGSAARQCADREHPVPQDSRISRHSSNASADNASSGQRSLPGARKLSIARKPSVSEPAPTGPQAEWRHLPALGQASRLHPPELRQLSRGQGRPEAMQPGALKAISPSASAAAMVDDRLPSLPSLAGARCQAPRAAEMLRKPSLVARSDVSRSDSQRPLPNAALLPGLADRKGGGGPGARMRMPSKRSFRGDRDF